MLVCNGFKSSGTFETNKVSWGMNFFESKLPSSVSESFGLKNHTSQIILVSELLLDSTLAPRMNELEQNGVKV